MSPFGANASNFYSESEMLSQQNIAVAHNRGGRYACTTATTTSTPRIARAQYVLQMEDADEQEE